MAYKNVFPMVFFFFFFILIFVHFKVTSSQQVPAIYVFGDSLVDVGNNNYLTLSLAKANYPPNGVDFPGRKATGRFCNGKNAADFLGKYKLLYILYMCMCIYKYICMCVSMNIT